MAPWSLLTEESAAFAPAANVSETEDEYRVSVELAGMGKDDVGVSIQEGRLTISGEKRKEEQEEKENYLRYERSYGSFTRTIPLPTSVDEGRISAKFKDGVLTVRLPKRPEARGKKVEITEG
jgi:HSP20 family protein